MLTLLTPLSHDSTSQRLLSSLQVKEAVHPESLVYVPPPDTPCDRRGRVLIDSYDSADLSRGSGAVAKVLDGGALAMMARVLEGGAGTQSNDGLGLLADGAALSGLLAAFARAYRMLPVDGTYDTEATMPPDTLEPIEAEKSPLFQSITLPRRDPSGWLRWEVWRGLCPYLLRHSPESSSVVVYGFRSDFGFGEDLGSPRTGESRQRQVRHRLSRPLRICQYPWLA